jgi:hypothetical protein
MCFLPWQAVAASGHVDVLINNGVSVGTHAVSSPGSLPAAAAAENTFLPFPRQGYAMLCYAMLCYAPGKGDISTVTFDSFDQTQRNSAGRASTA